MFACSFTAPQNTACTLYLSGKKKKKKKNKPHKGILQDNSTAKETGAQWSPDIIHNIDRRPLSTEGGAHVKVTGLGDRGIVRSVLPPRQQHPWSLTYKDRFYCANARWVEVLHVICNNLDHYSWRLLKGKITSFCFRRCQEKLTR